MDRRYQIFKERLESLSAEEIQRIIDNIDSVCLDTFNFDSENKTYCPLAIGMNLHQTITNPTNDIIVEEISKRFTPANALKGVDGKFYTFDRRNDLLSLCHEILKTK